MAYVRTDGGPPFSQEERASLLRAFQAKVPHIKCPLCGHQHFAIVEGYFSNPVQAELGNFALGGPTIPAAAIVCGNCGFISQHALGTLGLLPNKGSGK